MYRFGSLFAGAAGWCCEGDLCSKLQGLTVLQKQVEHGMSKSEHLIVQVYIDCHSARKSMLLSWTSNYNQAFHGMTTLVQIWA